MLEIFRNLPLNRTLEPKLGPKNAILGHFRPFLANKTVKTRSKPVKIGSQYPPGSCGCKLITIAHSGEPHCASARRNTRKIAFWPPERQGAPWAKNAIIRVFLWAEAQCGSPGWTMVISLHPQYPRGCCDPIWGGFEPILTV